jgi:hypothetical protein
MGILKKLLRRNESHEQWLEQHPGKSSVSVDAPAISLVDEAATRTRMEAELEQQRTRREKS